MLISFKYIYYIFLICLIKDIHDFEDPQLFHPYIERYLPPSPLATDHAPLVLKSRYARTSLKYLLVFINVRELYALYRFLTDSISYGRLQHFGVFSCLHSPDIHRPISNACDSYLLIHYLCLLYGLRLTRTLSMYVMFTQTHRPISDVCSVLMYSPNTFSTLILLLSIT